MEALQIIGFALICVGIILIGIEAFIPGFGIPGAIGVISLIVGGFMAGRSLAERVTIFIIIVVAVVTLFILGLVVINSKKIKTPIVLEEEVNACEKRTVCDNISDYIGKRGIALTDLKPVGKGSFEGESLEVVSELGFIKKGTSLTIIKIKDNNLIVKEEL